MKYIISIIGLSILAILFLNAHMAPKNSKKMNLLTPAEKKILIDKGTEAPFSGLYNLNTQKGTYVCKQCGFALYHSDAKFESSCGWPSFDEEIKGAVSRTMDKDGRRVEITCSNCGGHLGHVFEGEGYTKKNTRHCVNSLSLLFIPNTETGIFAGGCFWGVEHLLQQQKGVLTVVSGYIGGTTENPSYEQVSAKKTGHAEAVKVTFNPNEVSYETIAKLFFEIHDPTQANGQGPDIGPQYRSEIFYQSLEQKAIAEKLIKTLRDKGIKVVTQVTEASKFFPAEEYHQDYYVKKGKEPYCHIYTKRF